MLKYHLYQKMVSEFNLQQKTQRKHMFISPRSGGRGAPKIAMFEIHIMNWNGKVDL